MKDILVQLLASQLKDQLGARDKEKCPVAQNVLADPTQVAKPHSLAGAITSGSSEYSIPS